MKKTLALLGSMTLAVSGVGGVVSCDKSPKTDLSALDADLDLHEENFKNLSKESNENIQNYMVEWFYDIALKDVVHPAGFNPLKHLRIDDSIVSDVTKDDGTNSIKLDELNKALKGPETTKDGAINCWFHFKISTFDKDLYFINSSITLTWVNLDPDTPTKLI